MNLKINAPLILKNCSQILTISLAKGDLGIIENGTVIISQGKIVEIVAAAHRQVKTISAVERPKKVRGQSTTILDAQGCVVMPGFVDCHTHTVFAGTREEEFALRLSGISYEAILKSGGGIMNTVRKTRKASFRELFDLARKRIGEMISWGTTTLEIKSGYGLDIETELRILRVIKQLSKISKITIVPTFLGGHYIPPEKKKVTYLKEILHRMIPKVAKEKLAKFCDVFCEKFIFNKDDTKKILEKGKEYGLLPKIHADEIMASGGAEVAGEVGAISADHLYFPSKKGLRQMVKNNVSAVLLPGTALFLRKKKIPPIQTMRELNIPIGLGSDFNPGTCPIYQMPIIISLACLLYGLTIEEAIIGATLNSAKALRLEDRIGSLEPGKDADIIILDIPNYRHIPYQFGRNFIKTVIKKGKIIYQVKK